MAEKSSFLTLAIELRQQIYDEIFADAIIYLRSDDDGVVRPMHWWTYSGILGVSKQIREEAIPRFRLDLVAVGSSSPKSGSSTVMGLSETTRFSIINMTINDNILRGIRFDKKLFPRLETVVVQAAGLGGKQCYGRWDKQTPVERIRSLPQDVSYEEASLIKVGLHDAMFMHHSGNAMLRRLGMGVRASLTSTNVKIFFRHKFTTNTGPPAWKTSSEMTLTWSLVDQIVIERHWREVKDGRDVQECLTDGSCSLCSEMMSYDSSAPIFKEHYQGEFLHIMDEYASLDTLPY